jgi:eukaryotic-like serine/threonine-protein kinase
MNAGEQSSGIFDMFTAKTCPGCGARIRAGAPEGLCPRCLLALGLRLSAREPAPGKPEHFTLNDVSASGDARSFGDYELLEEIARGGMGIVYRARQVSLNRIVAVKVLLFGQFASAEFVKRFRDEAEAVACLQHPNIVGIHVVGEHENQHFFSMDYIEGPNLSGLVKEQPLPGRHAALLLKTLAEAVDYAHGRGILHRDLKPSNVLVDPTGEPHITDFGLAKRLTGDSHITLTGQIFGSPGYMPPEQASPGQHELGRASDIYSLGAILYFLVTGRPPFVAESVEATLTQVLTAEILSPRKLNPSLPPDLEIICLKCLEREPGRRYATASELADEFGRFLLGEPIHARPVSALERAGRWSARNPIISGLGALLGVVLAAFFAYALVSSSGIRREARRAQQAERQALNELWHSSLDQARAERRSNQAGQRFASLAAIRRAAAIRPSLELRDEAIAALALPDVRLIHTWPCTGGFTALAYSDTLDRFAIKRENGEISVCFASNGQEFARLPAVGHTPHWIAGFSPDEKLLPVMYSEDLNYLWDLASCTPVLGPISGVGCALLADGSQFVVAKSDSTLDFYSLATGRLLRSLKVPEPLPAMLFQSGSHLIVGFRHGSPVAHLLEFPSGVERFAFTLPANVASVALSPDGETLAVGCSDNRIYIWNTRTGLSRSVLEGHESRVIALGFNHAGTLLASTSWDDSLRLWDTASWKQIVLASGTSYELRFSADDHSLAHLEHGGVAGILEIATSDEFHLLQVQTNSNQEGWSVALSPDSHLVATGYSDGVALSDVASGMEFAWLPIGYCRSAIFVPDGSALITSGEDGLLFWPIAISHNDGKDEVILGKRRFIGEGLRFMAAALSGDGRWLAAATEAGDEVAVYEVAHPENRFSFTNITNVESVAATTDMRWLAAGTWGRTGITIWNVPQRRLETRLSFPGSARVAFSPDGKLLAAGGSKYEVWQAGSWRKLYDVNKPDSENGSGVMSFSPDSRRLAVVERGREIVVLEAASGNEIATLQAPRQIGIAAVCFSPDNSKLFALQTDQKIQIWDLRAMSQELAALNLNW